jgi:uncharacterized repeat protein (TIGR03803 family)
MSVLAAAIFYIPLTNQLRYRDITLNLGPVANSITWEVSLSVKPTSLLVSFLSLLIASITAAGQTPSAVFTFECSGNVFERSGSCPQGGRPDTLIQGADGNFYGTAQVSNEGTSTPTGGNVFSLTSAGKFTVLHTFMPGVNKNYPNGNLPGQIAEGPDGKLYGYTLYGGVGGCNGYCGSGVLYRIAKDGTGFQILHKFCSATNCTDGGAGAVVAGTDGNLYGASYTGGTGDCGQYYIGCGTLFRVTPSTGQYKVLINFQLSTIGAFPSRLTPAPDGSFYGVESGSTGENVFHFIPSTGALKTFALKIPSPDGLPVSAGDLTFGSNGNLYGLYAIYGMSGEGIFEVEKNGSNLQAFPFYTTQSGAGFPDGLILASDGNFWMADLNGTTAYGNIIKISPTTATILETYNVFGVSASVGAFPSVLMQANDGTLWGATTEYGKAPSGDFSDGTVFSFNVGLPPK